MNVSKYAILWNVAAVEKLRQHIALLGLVRYMPGTDSMLCLSAGNATKQSWLDCMSNPGELTEQETKAKQAKIMQLLSLSPRTSR